MKFIPMAVNFGHTKSEFNINISKCSTKFVNIKNSSGVRNDFN